MSGKEESSNLLKVIRLVAISEVKQVIYVWILLSNCRGMLSLTMIILWHDLHYPQQQQEQQQSQEPQCSLMAVFKHGIQHSMYFISLSKLREYLNILINVWSKFTTVKRSQKIGLVYSEIYSAVNTRAETESPA